MTIIRRRVMICDRKYLLCVPSKRGKNIIIIIIYNHLRENRGGEMIERPVSKNKPFDATQVRFRFFPPSSRNVLPRRKCEGFLFLWNKSIGNYLDRAESGKKKKKTQRTEREKRYARGGFTVD